MDDAGYGCLEGTFSILFFPTCCCSCCSCCCFVLFYRATTMIPFSFAPIGIVHIIMKIDERDVGEFFSIFSGLLGGH